jgi:hypothetical protein
MKKKIIPVQQILEESNDFELCDQLVHALAAKYGEDTMRMPGATVEEETVDLTWYAAGVLGQGFGRFFETVSPDLNYRKTIAAFRRIGCYDMANLIEKAVFLFPGGRVPPREYGDEKDVYGMSENAKEQIALFMSLPEAIRDDLDNQISGADKEIEVKLASYIREHKDAYRNLPPAVVIDVGG